MLYTYVRILGVALVSTIIKWVIIEAVTFCVPDVV